MRTVLKKQSSQESAVFTHRGRDSSRLEQLSDAVFALAITLLLISSVAEWTDAPWYAIAGGVIYFLVGPLEYMLEKRFVKKKPAVALALSPSSVSADSVHETTHTKARAQRNADSAPPSSSS